LKKEFKFVSGKEKEKINLFGKSEEEILSEVRMEITSNTEFTLEGCMGVLEFTQNYIKLNLKKGNITLCGKNLDINGFEQDSITVKGIIDSIEFCISERKNV